MEKQTPQEEVEELLGYARNIISDGSEGQAIEFVISDIEEAVNMLKIFKLFIIL
jgi:hypothetical protein